MKKYLSLLILFGLLLVPAMSSAEVSSTVSKQVVPLPILKKSYETVVSKQPASVAKIRTSLKRGDAGVDVRDLQALLLNHGFKITVIDGIFGKETDAAVREFQKLAGLTADGRFGAKSALFASTMTPGVSIKTLDTGTLQAVKEKYVATIVGSKVTPLVKKPVAVAVKNAQTNKAVKTVVAKLPKGVTLAQVISKSLPQAPKLTEIKLPDGTIAKSPTKKPKAEIANFLSKATISLVSASGKGSNLVATSLNKNFTKGETAEVTSKYICAKYKGDNTCVAVSLDLAAAIEAGQVSAADVIAAVMEEDNGGCPFCSRDEDGNITITSGGGCGAGGPGTGDFITPPSYPVPGTPSCIPKSQVANQKLNVVATADNVFTAFVGSKDANGVETIVPILKDMNWYEPTATSVNDTTGWKSAESAIGLSYPNPSAFYLAMADDDWVTAAALMHVQWGTGDYLSGVSPEYEVMVSTVDGPVHPNEFSVTELLDQIKNGIWKPSEYVASNGDSPWGFISLNGSQPNLDNAKWVYEDDAYNTNKYLIYRLKICEDDTPGPTPSDLCMNFRTDENGNPTNGKSYYKVTFDESVVVTGSPRLLIKKTATAPTVTATFDSYADADHKVLKFVADIGSGLNNNIDSPYYEGVGTIEHVNGSTIKTVVGAQNVSTAVGTFSFTDTCGGGTTTTNITITEDCRGNAAWPSPAQTITAFVDFGEPVTVTGVPEMVIKKITGGDGVVLKYALGSGTNKLTFHYSVPSPLPAGFNYVKEDFEGDYAFKLPLAAGVSIKKANGENINLSGRWTAPPGNLCPIPDAPTYNPSDVAHLTCMTKSVTGNSGNKVATFTLGTDKPVVVQGLPEIKASNLNSNTPPGVTLAYQSGTLTSKLIFKGFQTVLNIPDESFDFTNTNTHAQFSFPPSTWIKTLAPDGLTTFPHGLAVGSQGLPECTQ